MASRTLFTLVLASVTVAGPSVAQQLNYNPYPLGERATGMGGAYTALSNDEAGAYYNPAGPAFSRGNSLAVSTSFYGLVTGQYRELLGPNEDFRYSTLNLIPTTSSTLWHFGETTETESAPFVVMFNIFSPASLTVDQRRDVRQGSTVLFLSSDDKTIVAGPSVAYRFSPRFSLGIGAWVTFHTFRQRVDLTDVLQGGDPPQTVFIQVTQSQDETNFGGVGIIGARYALTERWFLGASVRSPTVHFAGSGSTFTRRAHTPFPEEPTGIATQTDNVESQRRVPARFALGVAYERPRKVAFSADVSVYPPLIYTSGRSSIDPSLDENVRNNWVVNAAVGAEYFVTDIIPIRAGLFTDFSGTPRPGVGPTDSSEDRIDLIGATLSTGISTERASTNFAIVAAFGWSEVVGFDLAQATYTPLLTTGTQWRLFFVWSSSYSY